MPDPEKMRRQEVSSLDSAFPVRKFETRKDFMELLGEMLVASFEYEPEEYMGETRGRPRLLKTYIMEANSDLPSKLSRTSATISRRSTKLPEISVLTFRDREKGARFYVDTSDKRFWILHTNNLARDANFFFQRLVQSPEAQLDKAWLPIEMMQRISSLSGNTFRGFGLSYQDFFGQNGEGEIPVEELRMRVHGSSSIDALDALKGKEKLRRSLSYSMIRVKRGNRREYVTEELTYAGRFIGKGGKSIDDYISLVEITRKMYRNTIETIERNSIGIREVDGRTLVEGQAFDFTLEREIEDIDLFIDHLVSSTEPFRLWGLKNKISKDFCQVACVDLHTGDAINLEVSPLLIRIYLPKGSCGNTILRLYANLQHRFDSAIRLNGEPLEVSE